MNKVTELSLHQYVTICALHLQISVGRNISRSFTAGNLTPNRMTLSASQFVRFHYGPIKLQRYGQTGLQLQHCSSDVGVNTLQLKLKVNLIFTVALQMF